MVAIRYRRNRGHWVVDWYEGGVRKTLAFKNPRTAQEFRRKKEEALERQRAGLDFVDPISFMDYSGLFLENQYKEKSPRYYKSSYYAITRHFQPILGEKLVHEVDQSDIVALRNELRAKNLSPKSVVNQLGLLYTMFKKAIDNGFAMRNPVEGVERPKNVVRTEQHPWGDEDFLFVMRNAPEDIKKAVILLHSTGIRYGELFRLEKADCDLLNGCLKVKSVEGKTTKTYRSRIVPLSDAAVKLLAQVPGPSIMGMTPKAFEHRWRAFKIRHDFTRRLHELRHTFISRMLKSGVDKKTIMEWVGHETSSITDRYSHVIPERMQDYRAKVNRGVGIDEAFLGDKAALVTPLQRPNGDQEFEVKKIPSKYDDLEGTFCSGGGIRTSIDREINNLATPQTSHQKQSGKSKRTVKWRS